MKKVIFKHNVENVDTGYTSGKGIVLTPSRIGFKNMVPVDDLDSSAAMGVTSFESRTGAVVSVAGDYTASEITNVASGTIAAITVQTAINELDTDKQADITWQEEGVTQGTAGGITTVNFTGTSITASPSGSTLTVNVNASNSYVTETVNGGRFTYVILSGTPVLTFDKSTATAPVLTVASGTIQLKEVRDTITTAVSVNPVYTFNATWTSALDAFPSFITKITVSSGQYDIDNTPQTIRTTNTTTQSVTTINAVATDMTFVFGWNNV